MKASPTALLNSSDAPSITIADSANLVAEMADFEDFFHSFPQIPLSRHPAWQLVLKRSMGHQPYCVTARSAGKIVGVLPLALVSSWLFGRFLISLPYVNYGGVLTHDASVAGPMIDAATKLADRVNARYLELRHETELPHAAFTHMSTTKVHMRRHLPAAPEKLFSDLHGKVRNQIRKGEKSNLDVIWGGLECLSEFHAVFSENMRDLGTPNFGIGLFRQILEQFPDSAEICVVRKESKAIASALLLHGTGITEVPSASSLRAFNSTNANMLMYWNLLKRAVERGQEVFDFGRSTRDGPTHAFKKQWGAVEQKAEWQYYVRIGSFGEMRVDNPRYGRMIRLWQKLPLFMSRFLGPKIARGIP